MIKLSDAQRAVVEAEIGISMQVLASAGSGKTRVLTERVRYILDNTRKDSVIALTFTNKAADEMLERLNNSDDAMERCWIATIHSIAQRIIEQYGYTIGLPSEVHIFEREKDRMEVFLQSIREQGIDIDSYLDVTDNRERKTREKTMQNYMDGFSIIKRELLNEDGVKNKYPHDERFWYIFQDYQNALINSGGIDYDDILVYAHKILLTQDWVGNIYRSKYKHVCVDEAQDLNKAQYEFIKALCGESIKSIMLVGDPNQMIYGFNSSSIRYLCNDFITDYSPVKFELKENYRSAKEVIRIANKLKPNSQNESEAAIVGAVHFQEAENEFMEAGWVTLTIQHLLELKEHKDIEGNISLERMVVIARNRFVFSALEKSLSEHGIKYSLKRGERNEEPRSIFGKVLDYAIRIKLNPKDWVDGKKLCQSIKVVPPSTWGGHNVLVDLANKVLHSDIAYPELQSELLTGLDKLETENPNIRKFINSFDKKLNSLVFLTKDEKLKSELESSILDLNEFSKCWTRFKQKGLGNTLQAFRNAISLGQLSEEVVHGGLTLSTVHTMKGLEKDIVFIIGLCEGIFPDYRAKSDNDINEERNSAFVAVTRAKRWLYLSYPMKRLMPWGDIKNQNPSRFFLEMSK